MRTRVGSALGVAALILASIFGAAQATGIATARKTSQTLATVVTVRPLMHLVAHFFGARPPTTSQCEATFGSACYDPLQIERAYAENALFKAGLNGKGRTIALVDSFGSPTIRRDLAKFDSSFGLPAPPSFKIIQPAGTVPAYNPKNSTMTSWAFETTLDVEYAHAMAPGARILLVETPVAETQGVVGFPQIVQAENFVIYHNMADVISQSFAATEQTFPSLDSLLDLRSAYRNAARHHVTVLAASGDYGATDPKNPAGTLLYTHRVVAWPASDALVTAVGGTQLHLNNAGRRVAPDNVWNDNPVAGGGGRSVIFPRPWWQNTVANVVGRARGIPDVALSAACSGFVWLYLSFAPLGPGFQGVCGTSEASPLFAGIVAIADQAAGHRLGLLNPALYRLASAGAPGIVDVTAGNNTVSFAQGGSQHTVRGFVAVRGYDLASGVGTVDAAKLVPELAASGASAGK